MQKKRNATNSSVFKLLRQLSYIYYNLDPLKIPLIFIISVKRLVITKNSVVKIQNLLVNHESLPVKSNPILLSNSLVKLCYNL